MAQSSSKIVSANAEIVKRKGKVKAVIVAVPAVTSFIELFNNADGSGTAFFKMAGTTAISVDQLDIPFALLYAKLTGAATYTVVWE